MAFANLVQGMHIEVVQTSNGAVVPASQVPADSLVPGAAHQITGGLLTMVTPFTLLAMVGVPVFAVLLSRRRGSR